MSSPFWYMNRIGLARCNFSVKSVIRFTAPVIFVLLELTETFRKPFIKFMVDRVSATTQGRRKLFGFYKCSLFPARPIGGHSLNPRDHRNINSIPHHLNSCTRSFFSSEASGKTKTPDTKGIIYPPPHTTTTAITAAKCPLKPMIPYFLVCIPLKRQKRRGIEVRVYCPIEIDARGIKKPDTTTTSSLFTGFLPAPTHSTAYYFCSPLTTKVVKPTQATSFSDSFSTPSRIVLPFTVRAQRGLRVARSSADYANLVCFSRSALPPPSTVQFINSSVTEYCLLPPSSTQYSTPYNLKTSPFEWVLSGARTSRVINQWARHGYFIPQQRTDMHFFCFVFVGYLSLRLGAQAGGDAGLFSMEGNMDVD
ncbi:uncharacterized protein BDR25DRAFT_350822 [Lindgomyces ingoldianus]|uniref:Uncharacterized protein n=1 Tax=Lindgomyces ingoldianus TaxID=673940 RepID=A0ACB6RAF1_9PLEO|nr:uncharacterized protein BDR25DRAFT_350822 [Lindgomyces ingoldianus]KAF2475446.1 hypothetical protein BDR25DRAFT_350822 [Lindgomyces ingoldianus]